jgi:hypothetical protein
MEEILFPLGLVVFIGWLVFISWKNTNGFKDWFD